MIENISIVKTIDVPSGKARAAIRKIDRLDRWFPVTESCRVEGEGVGAIRILGLGNGGEIRDRVEDIDDQARRFRYLRTQHPFPVSSYKGAVSVQNAGEGKSEVTWAVEIDVAADARDGTVAFLSAALSDGLLGFAEEACGFVGVWLASFLVIAKVHPCQSFRRGGAHLSSGAA